MGTMTRRQVVSVLAGSAGAGSLAVAAAARSFPSAAKRFLDPATEFPLVRLTSPEYNSYLPAASGRCIQRKGGFLVFLSDRAGAIGLYRIELKGGEVSLLAEGQNLDPHFAALFPDDRTCCYADGDSLLQASTQPSAGAAAANAKARELYRSPEGWHRAGSPVMTEDGIGAVWPEQKGQTFRLRFVSFAKAAPVTMAEAPQPFLDLQPRPRRASAAYRKEGELWLANYDGQQNYRLRLDSSDAASTVTAAQWTSDGRSLLYLRRPAAPGLAEIHEFTPDTNEDKLVAKTSQFVAFARNADASVFVGASGSKASPYLFLLVRAVRRELAIAEHKDSAPANVAPVFSPNSQRVFFSSDRDGKRCIYGMMVDKLVEATEPS